MKIGFIGVGKLGKEAAEVMAEKHFVEGFDLVDVYPSNFNMVGSLKEVCAGKDIIFIAVQTPHDTLYEGKTPMEHLPPKDFDYSIVKEVLTDINEFTNKDQLVVLISTVLPGTTRREFIPLVKNYRFIYNPYLIAMGTVKHDMRYPEMMMIGTEDGTRTGDAKLLTELYDTFVAEGTRYEIGTWDEAEGMKIFYNTFISTKIALVNMIQDVAEKNGNMNADVVTGALARSTKRIVSDMYMTPGMGDGGGCHPRDNIALRYMAKKLDLGYDIFQTIMAARDIQAKNIAERLVQLSKVFKLPVVIMGRAFKPNVKSDEGSSSVLTGHFVEELGVPVSYDNTYEPAVYLLAHKDTFNDLTFPKGSVILDVWRKYKPADQNVKVVYYGFDNNRH